MAAIVLLDNSRLVSADAEIGNVFQELTVELFCCCMLYMMILFLHDSSCQVETWYDPNSLPLLESRELTVLNSLPKKRETLNASYKLV